MNSLTMLAKFMEVRVEAPPTSKRRKARRSSRAFTRTQPSAIRANRSEAGHFTAARKGFLFSRTS